MAHESDAATLIDDLRNDTELDDEHELDALARVEQSLMLRVLDGGAIDDAPASRLRSPSPTRWWRSARGGMAAALLVGTALGAGGHAVASFVASQQPTPAAVSTESAAPKSPRDASQPTQKLAGIPAENVTESTEVAAPSADANTPKTPLSAAPKAAAAPSAPPSIELELSELEEARRAISQGAGHSALSILARHRQRYPGSVLAQEREALTVKALVLAGRHDDARNLAASFKARHPSSMLLDSVERSLRSIP